SDSAEGAQTASTETASKAPCSEANLSILQLVGLFHGRVDPLIEVKIVGRPGGRDIVGRVVLDAQAAGRQLFRLLRDLFAGARLGDLLAATKVTTPVPHHGGGGGILLILPCEFAVVLAKAIYGPLKGSQVDVIV